MIVTALVGASLAVQVGLNATMRLYVGASLVTFLQHGAMAVAAAA
jgi:hypothetical protein